MSIHVLATPTRGLEKSSSRSPTARSMARAGARCAPSVSVRLRGLGSCSVNSAVLSRWVSAFLRRVLILKTQGHHPALDDGPESFRCFCARPPSSGCETPYDDGDNSYDDR